MAIEHTVIIVVVSEPLGSLFTVVGSVCRNSSDIDGVVVHEELTVHASTSEGNAGETIHTSRQLVDSGLQGVTLVVPELSNTVRRCSNVNLLTLHVGNSPTLGIGLDRSSVSDVLSCQVLRFGGRSDVLDSF